MLHRPIYFILKLCRFQSSDRQVFCIKCSFFYVKLLSAMMASLLKNNLYMNTKICVYFSLNLTSVLLDLEVNLPLSYSYFIFQSFHHSLSYPTLGALRTKAKDNLIIHTKEHNYKKLEHLLKHLEPQLSATDTYVGQSNHPYQGT